jgi:hypothetical protein
MLLMRHIHPRTWECEAREDWTSKYNWARNRRPPLNARIIWKEALGRAFLWQGPGRVLQLRNQLGQWRVHKEEEWLWRYNPQDERLYCRSQGRWSYWRKVHGRTRSQRFQFTDWIDQCPDETLRASGDHLRDDKVIVHSKETTNDRYRPQKRLHQLHFSTLWLRYQPLRHGPLNGYWSRASPSK